MIEVTLKVRFKTTDFEEAISIYELAEALSNVLDLRGQDVWNINGEIEFERTAYEKNKAIKFNKNNQKIAYESSKNCSVKEV